VTDITLTFPVELTAAQIIRLHAKPGDKSKAVTEADEAKALELAKRLHSFLATAPGARSIAASAHRFDSLHRRGSCRCDAAPGARPCADEPRHSVS
jgi:hypothetical protein